MKNRNCFLKGSNSFLPFASFLLLASNDILPFRVFKHGLRFHHHMQVQTLNAAKPPGPWHCPVQSPSTLPQQEQPRALGPSLLDTAHEHEHA